VICGYVRGGRQCDRLARAAVTLVVPGHEPPSLSVSQLCLDHVLHVVELQGRGDTYDGASTLIAWGVGVSESAGE
jgi:hypothetical protein